MNPLVNDIAQVAIYNLEKAVEGRVYRFSMQMGGQWSEAIQAVQDIADKVKELADLAAQQVAAAQQAATQQVATEPVSTEAVE